MVDTSEVITFFTSFITSLQVFTFAFVLKIACSLIFTCFKLREAMVSHAFLLSWHALQVEVVKVPQPARRRRPKQIAPF